MFESLANDISNLILQAPYLWIFILMAIESTFVPLPSEIIMIPAGYFAAQGKLNIILAVISGMFGSVAGALINYKIAEHGGQKLGLKLMGQKYFDLGIHFFKKHGNSSTFIGRLIPGIRHYISFPAGLFKMNMKMFVTYTALGAGIWCLFLAWVGWFFGENKEMLEKYKIYFIIGVLILAILIIPTKNWFMKFLRK